MEPVRLRRYLGKVFKRKVVVIALLTLFCTAVITNVYFISNMAIEFTNSPKGQEGLEHQWRKRGLIFSKEQIVKALAAGHRNATDWAEREIIAEVKTLHPKYSKPDLSRFSVLENKIKLKLIPKGQTQVSVHELNHIWSLAKNWNEEKNLTATAAILSVLCSAKILYAEMSRSGTQLKLLLSLEGGQQALFKPQWYSRDEVIDGPVYAGRDRHNAEVAAFYLSVILNMNKVPYVVGRRVNLRREIMPVANKGLLETFVQNTTHTCFYGNCPSCNPSFMVCGGRHSEDNAYKIEGDVLEGALVLMLPPYFRLKKYRHPWQRTYSNFSARWEVQVNYCEAVKQTKLYSPTGNRLLDLIDASIFDFLMDNGDRHHYEIIQESNVDSVLLLDNGKGFGNPNRDHVDILAPLYQCCIIRETTYRTLLALRGNKLSTLMRRAQEDSHIAPLLSENHLSALDRRLTLTFAAIEICFRDYGEPNVLLK